MKTKQQATQIGRELLKQLKGKGWKLDVWENLGWHCCAYNGPLNVHYSSHDKSYSCLLSSNMPEKGKRDAGGSGRWLLRTHYRDPQEAVEAQIQLARQVIETDHADDNQLLTHLEKILELPTEKLDDALLTDEYIKERLSSIRQWAKAKDCEAAHGTEDDLYHEFIEWVANHANLPAALRRKAELILSSNKIKFDRYSS